MFGLAQFSEKRQRSAEAARAEQAFEAARVQPLEIQQYIARGALQVCANVMKNLATLPRNNKREVLVRLQFGELEQRISQVSIKADAIDMPPEAIAAVLGQTLLAASSDTLPGKGLRSVGERIAMWSQNVLPDFNRYQAQLVN